MNNFENELRALINSYSIENDSNTPDFILASYLNACLTNFNDTIKNREAWYGRVPENHDLAMENQE